MKQVIDCYGNKFQHENGKFKQIGTFKMAKGDKDLTISEWMQDLKFRATLK